MELQPFVGFALLQYFQNTVLFNVAALRLFSPQILLSYANIQSIHRNINLPLLILWVILSSTILGISDPWHPERHPHLHIGVISVFPSPVLSFLSDAKIVWLRLAWLEHSPHKPQHTKVATVGGCYPTLHISRWVVHWRPKVNKFL